MTRFSTAGIDPSVFARIDFSDLLAALGRDPKRVEGPLAAIRAAFPQHFSHDAAGVSEELAQNVNALLTKAGDAATAVGKKAVETTDATHEHLEKHPVATATAALAIGYLLGRAALHTPARQKH